MTVFGRCCKQLYDDAFWKTDVECWLIFGWKPTLKRTFQWHFCLPITTLILCRGKLSSHNKWWFWLTFHDTYIMSSFYISELYYNDEFWLTFHDTYITSTLYSRVILQWRFYYTFNDRNTMSSYKNTYITMMILLTLHDIVNTIYYDML